MIEPQTQPARLEVRISSLSLLKRAALIVLLGLLQAASFPPVGLAFLLPLCFAAFLMLIGGLEIKWAFRLAFLYGLAWFGADTFWFTNIFGTAAISLWAILAFFPGLFAGLFVWMRRRLPQIPFWLLAAVLWTGIEYYRSELFILNFGWMGLSYAFVNDHALARIASWIGCYGLTFVIASISGIIAQWLLQYSPPSGPATLQWPVLAYVVLLILYAIPLPAPVLVNPMRVRLVQSPAEQDAVQFGLSQPTPGFTPDVIVWPEYSFLSDPLSRPITARPLAELARKNNAYLLFGAKDAISPTDPKSYRNTAFMLDRGGKLVGKHVKNHTVHFFDDGIPGTDAYAIQTDLGRIGVAICFDMDYEDVARRLVGDGAEALLVPNMDPPEWGRIQRIQHRLMFQMRALECGRWLARADVAGGTSVALPTGAELTRVDTTGPAKLDVTLARLNYKTPFVRGGWMFGPVIMEVGIGLWAFGIWYGLIGGRAGTRH